MERILAGRYELEQLLGAGGTSGVWCATDRKLERRVALKLLAPQADTVRFEREAHAVASLAHPNIVQLYDYGEDAGRPYIVLEFLSGGTLEERLTPDRPLDDAETHSIARDVAAALAHAHARGIVHRDLKPANVLFDDEARAKLADFGIARYALGGGTVTEEGTLIGTATYMSPEQAAGEPVTAASDVYSFGVILYQMLTGRLPFEAADPLELLALHRTAVPPPLSLHRSDAPPALAPTTMAALAKSPDDRPADGRALLVALGGLEDAAVATATAMLPVAAAPPSATAAQTAPMPAPASPLPPPRRRAMLFGAAALIALALAGAFLALAVSGPGGSSPGEVTFPHGTHAKAKARRGTTSSTPTTEHSASSTQTPRPDTTAPTITTAHATTERGATTDSSATTHQATTTTAPSAVSTTATTAPDTTTAPATTATTTTASTTTTTATTTTAATTTG